MRGLCPGHRRVVAVVDVVVVVVDVFVVAAVAFTIFSLP